MHELYFQTLHKAIFTENCILHHSCNSVSLSLSLSLMGKKTNQRNRKGPSKGPSKQSQSVERDDEDLLKNFTTKDDWNEFFTHRTVENPFERFADWSQLQSLLLESLSSLTSAPEKLQADLSILVPACGSSRLSEKLYDAGFLKIMNVDFSSVVIEDMSNRNREIRQGMEWRLMDITKMTEICDEEYDAIVDKGGLKPTNDPKLWPLYIHEVKRILKIGGKYICVTPADTCFLELLLQTLRFGWKSCVYGIDRLGQKSAKILFVVVAEKDEHTTHISTVSLFWKNKFIECGDEGCSEAIRTENKSRDAYTSGALRAYSILDMKQGAKGLISDFEPGRIVRLMLTDDGVENTFNATLVDAGQNSGLFKREFAVQIIPKLSVSRWLYESTEWQLRMVKTCQAARLLIVFLDPCHSTCSVESINEDIALLAKNLAPVNTDSVQVLAADEYFQEFTVHEVTSSKEMLVEDVAFVAFNDIRLRRLNVKKDGNHLVTYETLLHEQKAGQMEVHHNFLGDEYHNAIVAGCFVFNAISGRQLQPLDSFSAVDMPRVVVIGLGAGLLPMFLRRNIPSFKIEVVESDREVLEVAKEFFSFKEDEQLEVRIAHELEFVRGLVSGGVDIFIVDFDALDLSPGMSLSDFIFKSKQSLSSGGMLVMDLARWRGLDDDLIDGVIGFIHDCYTSSFYVKDVVFAFKDEPITDIRLERAKRTAVRALEESSWIVRELALSIEHGRYLQSKMFTVTRERLRERKHRAGSIFIAETKKLNQTEWKSR